MYSWVAVCSCPGRPPSLTLLIHQDLRSRASLLFQLSQKLRQLASDHGLVVVVVNQVSPRLVPAGHSAPISLILSPLLLHVWGRRGHRLCVCGCATAPPWCPLQASDVMTDGDAAVYGAASDLDSAVYSAPDRGFLGPGLGTSKVTPALGFAWSNAVNTRLVFALPWRCWSFPVR